MMSQILDRLKWPWEKQQNSASTGWDGKMNRSKWSTEWKWVLKQENTCHCYRLILSQHLIHFLEVFGIFNRRLYFHLRLGSRITEKLLNRFPWNLVEGCGTTQGRSHNIFGAEPIRGWSRCWFFLHYIFFFFSQEVIHRSLWKNNP